MKYVKHAAFIAALCVATAPMAAYAYAAEPENVTGCLHTAKQVAAAIEAAQQPNAEAARHEQGLGRDFCTNGFFHLGLAHYAKALELAGAKS